MFKVNKKDTRARIVALFWYLYVNASWIIRSYLKENLSYTINFFLFHYKWHSAGKANIFTSNDMTETEISALLQMKLFSTMYVVFVFFFFFKSANCFNTFKIILRKWRFLCWIQQFRFEKKTTENCSQCCFSGILQLILHKVYKEVIELYVHWFIML